MSHLPQRQKPALAQTRGELRVYLECRRCAGTGECTFTNCVCGACHLCDGTGRFLTDVVSQTRAGRHARTTRNEALDNHGRQPYD